MNDFKTLIATAAFVIFFLVFGILDILDNPVMKFILIGGFLLIIIKIILTKSKEDDNKKNLPD